MLKLDLMKKCSKCKKSKSIDDFYRSARDKSGRRSECRECTDEYAKEYHYKNREKRKLASQKFHLQMLARKYGVSMNYIRGTYDFGCELCGEKNIRKLCIDHDHITGKIRGCLCNTCNKRLGIIENNAEWLAKAIEYQSKFRLKKRSA